MERSATISLLRRYESRNVTYLDPDGGWPIVWQRARGVHVWDENGKKYVDLTAAFGVASTGHSNPKVVRSGQKQMARLLHAMGDVHPHRLKASLAQKLSELTFERWQAGDAKTIFCNSGFEAVEAALKTALLATSRPGVIAFRGAYHGLGYGALTSTHRAHFRNPFRRQLADFCSFAPFPESENDVLKALQGVRKLLQKGNVGAVLVEPMQARGGIRIPPVSFLKGLREFCDRAGALLIADEIYTGFGRTGRWFACEHSEVVPDLICLGKALTGGFPLSACTGKAAIMDRAWPLSTGEAIHTSTFLGHPVGCAMALANIGEIQRMGLVARAEKLGRSLFSRLQELEHPRLKLEARGEGLMAGLEIWDGRGQPATRITLQLVKNLLKRGFIFLPEGAEANVLAFTPPLTIRETDLNKSVAAVGKELEKL